MVFCHNTQMNLEIIMVMGNSNLQAQEASLTSTKLALSFFHFKTGNAWKGILQFCDSNGSIAILCIVNIACCESSLHIKV
jgi:hypothetical protein